MFRVRHRQVVEDDSFVAQAPVGLDIECDKPSSGRLEDLAVPLNDVHIGHVVPLTDRERVGTRERPKVCNDEHVTDDRDPSRVDEPVRHSRQREVTAIVVRELEMRNPCAKRDVPVPVASQFDVHGYGRQGIDAAHFESSV